MIAGQLRIECHLREGSVTVVVVQRVRSDVANEDVGEAIVIKVTDSGSLTVACVTQYRIGADILELITTDVPKNLIARRIDSVRYRPGRTLR